MDCLNDLLEKKIVESGNVRVSKHFLFELSGKVTGMSFDINDVWDGWYAGNSRSTRNIEKEATEHTPPQPMSACNYSTVYRPAIAARRGRITNPSSDMFSDPSTLLLLDALDELRSDHRKLILILCVTSCTSLLIIAVQFRTIQKALGPVAVQRCNTQ